VSKNEPINKSMMIIVIDWMIDVCKTFKIGIRTTIAAIDMIQRFVGIYPVTKDKLQLISIGCMSLMTKLIETFPTDISDWVYICDNAYNSQDIKEIELLISDELNYIFISPKINNIVHKLISITKDILDNDLIKYKCTNFHSVMKKLLSSIKATNIYIGLISYSSIESMLDDII
jgi:hypothetical protein